MAASPKAGHHYPVEESLVVEPLELEFESNGPETDPFMSPIPATLRIHNKNDKAVMFKVKTTAPKRYYVRPNAASLAPNENIDIEVVLQKQQPSEVLGPSEKKKDKLQDKFLIQISFSDTPLMLGRPATDVSEWWRALEAKSKEMNPKPLDSPKAKAKVEWKEIRLKAVLKILGKGDSHHQQVDIGHLAQVETEMGRQLDAMTEENKKLKNEIHLLKASNEQPAPSGDVMKVAALEKELAELKAAGAGGAAPAPSPGTNYGLLAVIVLLIAVIAGLVQMTWGQPLQNVVKTMSE